MHANMAAAILEPQFKAMRLPAHTKKCYFVINNLVASSCLNQYLSLERKSPAMPGLNECIGAHRRAMERHTDGSWNHAPIGA